MSLFPKNSAFFEFSNFFEFFSCLKFTPYSRKKTDFSFIQKLSVKTLAKPIQVINRITISQKYFHKNVKIEIIG